MHKLPSGVTSVLTATQQQRVSELVKLHHYAMIIELLGDKAVPPHIVTRVKTAGLYRKPRPSVVGSSLRRAFMHGKTSLLTPDVLSMDEIEFDRFITKKGISLSRDETEAYGLVQRSFVGYVETLAEDMTREVNKALLKADKKLQRKLAQRQRDSLILELERRKALASIAKDMQEITTSTLHSAKRTITTETNNAFQDGRAQEIIAKAGESDPLVFKRPRHDACDDCNKAYLENDEITPKVFRLSELVENGTNIGKSRADRMPVVDSFHPWCACELYWLPPGFGFNEKGAMTYIGKATA